jgi:sporulation protein YlmC with PRC-barrel domain
MAHCVLPDRLGGIYMKALNLTLIAGLVGIGLFVTPTTKGSTEVANLTGCLARGDRPHQYSLTDGNGTTYGLLPDASVNMKKHVGQTVRVTGMVIKAKKEQREAQESGNPVDTEYLRVNQVKKVSASCP